MTSSKINSKDVDNSIYNIDNKPSADDVGAIPKTRKINNQTLDSDVILTASDIGARSNTWMPTASDVGAFGFIRALSTDEDLNNITNNGGYYAGTTTANTIINSPITDAFQLIVFHADNSTTGGRIIQIITRINIDAKEWYVRKSVSGVWSDWREIAFADSFLPLDGSVPMSGVFNIGDGLGRIHADTTQAYLMSRENKDGSGMSKILAIRHSSNIPVAIQTYQDGAYVRGSTKAIFGEHNKELLTETKMNLPLADGYTTSYGCYYYKNADGEVTIRFHIVADETKTANTRYPIGTLPAGYRPNGIMFAPCMNTGESYRTPQTGMVIISKGEAIEVVCETDWKVVAATFTFKADS